MSILEYRFAFDIVNNVDTLGFSYDYMSIMQYEWNSFSMNGQITMEPINPRGVNLINAAFKNSLTNIDVAEIRKLYGCV